jgi:hypothetical protein
VGLGEAPAVSSDRSAAPVRLSFPGEPTEVAFWVVELPSGPGPGVTMEAGKLWRYVVPTRVPSRRRAAAL